MSTSEYFFEDDHGNVRSTPLDDHVARGRCSGIPECCIAFYLSPNFALAPTGWGYGACPECVRTGNRVVIKDCADDDGANCTCGAWARSRVVDDDE